MNAARSWQLVARIAAAHLLQDCAAKSGPDRRPDLLAFAEALDAGTPADTVAAFIAAQMDAEQTAPACWHWIMAIPFACPSP